MNIIQHIESYQPDYPRIKQESNFYTCDTREVDISVVVPVHGRLNCNTILTKHLKAAINHVSDIITVSITFVEHSDSPEHLEICKRNKTNHISFPITPGLTGKFNKCLIQNLGALYSNKAKYYLFHDIDLLMGATFFEDILANIKRKKYDAVQCFDSKKGGITYIDKIATDAVCQKSAYVTDVGKKYPENVKPGVPGATGGSWCVSHKLFHKVGGYDEALTEYSIEDTLFMTKLATLGRIGFCDNPPIELVHMHHPPAFNRITKPQDWDFFNSFTDMDTDGRLQYMNLKSKHLQRK